MRIEKRVPAQPIVKELIFMIRDVEMISKRADDMCRREMGITGTGKNVINLSRK